MLRFVKFVCILSLTSIAVAQRPVGVSAVPDHWVGSWATSPVVAKNASGKFGAEGNDGTTLREIVHLSIGGPEVRVIFTNEFGAEPLTIGAAGVAVRAYGSDVEAGSTTPLSFGGRSSVTIPPGALVVSDAALLKVAALSDLAVSFFLPDQPVTQLTLHSFANQTSYYVAGNAVAAAGLTSPKMIASWDFLKGVDVKAGGDSGAIVAFGDSITDGTHSTKDANRRWPDVLAQRLLADKRTAGLGVLNEGIGGNRILHDVAGPSALARFDRDVLAQAGVKYLIILEGINDIGHASDPDPAKRYDIVSADDLIAGYSQMVRRAHTHGIKVIGATLTPYVGAKYASPEGEAIRTALNQWIRTTKELDGVIDFDKVTSDPAKPGVYLPAYDSNDELHPSDAGYKAMGESIDLTLFANGAVKIPAAKPKK
jgi:lysophospholipase L1-like esterase